MDFSDMKTKIYSQNILLNGCDEDNQCGCNKCNTSRRRYPTCVCTSCNRTNPITINKRLPLKISSRAVFTIILNSGF